MIFSVGPIRFSVEQGDVLGGAADALICPIDKDISLRLGLVEEIRELEGPGLINRVRAATQGFKTGLGGAFKVQAQKMNVRWIFFSVVYDIYWSRFRPGFISQSLRSVFDQASREHLRHLMVSYLGPPSMDHPEAVVAHETLDALLAHGRSRTIPSGVRLVRLLLPSQELCDLFCGQFKGRIPLAEEKPVKVDKDPLPEPTLSLEPLPVQEPQTSQKLPDVSVIAVVSPQGEMERLLKSLDQAEHAMEIIPSLARAKEVLRSRAPDVVLLDYEARYLGDNLASILKEIRGLVGPGIGTVLVAENYLFETLVEAIASDVDAFLGKPAGKAALAQALRTAIDKSKLRRDQAKLLEDLKRFNRMQEQFLQMVSHDLKNPLSVMKGGVEMLRDLLGEGPSAEKGLRVHRLVSGSLDQMLGLVRDLTDFTSMQVGKLKIEPQEVDLGPFLRQIFDGFRVLAAARGVGFSADIQPGLPRVWMDPARIQQVLMNLLGNALKHTPKGGGITLRASAGKEGVHMAVEDTGAGIDPKDLPSLFEPFYQVEKEAVNKKEGLGLGLAICRGILAQHKGEIWAESEGIGKGARMGFRLPLDGGGPPLLST